jgi:hypothetical protein
MKTMGPITNVNLATSIEKKRVLVRLMETKRQQVLFTEIIGLGKGFCGHKCDVMIWTSHTIKIGEVHVWKSAEQLISGDFQAIFSKRRGRDMSGLPQLCVARKNKPRKRPLIGERGSPLWSFI